MIEHLTAATFDEAVAADTPVVVDFWAAWCGPCKAMEPILDELAAERSGTLKVAKVNADDEAGLARRFEVMSLPTLLVFADGELKGRIVGARGSAALNAELDRMLGA